MLSQGGSFSTPDAHKGHLYIFRRPFDLPTPFGGAREDGAATYVGMPLVGIRRGLVSLLGIKYRIPGNAQKYIALLDDG